MRRLYETTFPAIADLPEGVTGVDAGMTLTKVVRATGAGIEAFAFETAGATSLDAIGIHAANSIGVTGARAAAYAAIANAVASQEIEAAALGARALLGGDDNADFVLALLGTGTAFAAVRQSKAQHLGGTPLGGGSFAGIARRLVRGMTYREIIEAAARGDRTRVDLMVSDAYPEGIGRIGGAMTAAHLAKADDASADDVLAALLNLHGENIAQIAASRAVIAQVPRLVLAGGFAHDNAALVASVAGMTALFGVRAEAVPHAGFAGALGAALHACRND